MFFKHSGIEIYMDDFEFELKGSEYEKFTTTYVKPVFNILAAIAWFHIIKYLIYG